MTWCEEPLFDLAALDATGETAIRQLRTETQYGNLFTGQPDMQAEVWYSRIGLASTLKAHKELDIRMDMGEGKRSLLLIHADVPVEADIVSLADHCITVLPDEAETPDQALAGIIRQWFDMITSPGLINMDWKDLRVILEPGWMGYCVRASGEGPDRCSEAVSAVRRQLQPLLGRRRSAINLMASIVSDDSLGLDEYNTVGQGLLEMGDTDNCVIGTILDQQDRFEVRVLVVMLIS